MEDTMSVRDDSAADGPDRLEEFQAELARLRVKRASPATEQRLLLAGIVLMPVGLVLVLVGYLGASGTTQLSSQIPYLISGGLMGLGCTIVGAALFLRYSLGRYLRFWLLRLIFEEHTTADRQVDALERLGDQLARDRSTNRAANPADRAKETQL
jgi:hypothetical protein